MIGIRSRKYLGAWARYVARHSLPASVDIQYENAGPKKKARCACDGSVRAGWVRVLYHTHTGYIDHTRSRMLYGLGTAENMLVYGADVTNAFGNAPPPKQV